MPWPGTDGVGSTPAHFRHPVGHSALKPPKDPAGTIVFWLVGGPGEASRWYMCSNRVMEKRKHWWNGRWGRLSRRDILLYEDAGQWWIEARHGGSEGRTRWLECAGEDSALDVVRDLMIGTDGWRELPTI